ncbi:MAG: DNA primase large subunit PriL [Methanoregula sp.]|nr:DNA primase large subunit PriL [Methanoregula sp.]
MDFRPSAKELSHFPFLKKAQDYIKDIFPPLEVLLKQERGKIITDLALTRISHALSQKRSFISHFQQRHEDEIASFVVSRIIASCIQDKNLFDRLARYEAERAYYFLVSEIGTENGERGWNENTPLDEEGYSPLSKYIANEFRINISSDRMPLADYVEIAAPLHDARFKLVNRRVQQGYVEIKKEERYELLRERIRVFLRRDLPFKIPKPLCEQLDPVAEPVKKVYQEQMLQQFGAIDEDAFPPCMKALILALTSGTNLTHAGRFALTTFIHAVGMDVISIARLYARSPDFDAEKTMYQVEHITGRGGTGTEYSPPACAAMMTTGLCVHQDGLCEKISHPLSYYKVRKKDMAKTKKTPETNPNVI